MITGKYAGSIIYKRHSIRSFTDGDITDEQLEHVLHAGMAAPSASNSQCWSFVVIDEREKLDKIPTFHKYTNMMRQARMAILPCAVPADGIIGKFFQQDMAACVENMLIAAVECGLGACWCGVHPVAEIEQGFRDLCGIPSDVIPFCVIALGVPAEHHEPKDRYDASRVFKNEWQAR